MILPGPRETVDDVLAELAKKLSLPFLTCV